MCWVSLDIPVFWVPRIQEGKEENEKAQQTGLVLASQADILLARHALLPNVGEERLRDKPKECLRGRLGKCKKMLKKKDRACEAGQLRVN